MLILYLAFLCTALYLVARILSPEMKRPAPVVPVPRSNVPVSSAPEETDSRIEKLETLLAEKCQDIKHLQRELQIFNIQNAPFYWGKRCIMWCLPNKSGKCWRQSTILQILDT